MNATVLQNLEYTSFENNDSIRLLTILPGSSSSIVFCELETVQLHDDSDFVAASYTWSEQRLWPGSLLSAVLTMGRACVLALYTSLVEGAIGVAYGQQSTPK
jgi:hypothetical protein